MFIEKTETFLISPLGGARINSERLHLNPIPLLRAEPEFAHARSINMSPLTG